MRRALLGAGLGLILLGCAVAGDRPAPTTAPAATAGYLDVAVIAPLAAASPAAPAPGSPADASDRGASAAYVALQDSDRWRLAQTHAEMRPPLAMQHFDCPLRTRLSKAPPPALERLMTRALRDAAAAADQARARSFRARPIADDPARRACVRVGDDLRSSASHPSAHATAGSLWGLVFADLAPDEAAALRRRGNEIGTSRAVCGLNYPADVAAGQALARSLYAELRQDPDYQADLAAARAEIAAARALGMVNPACAAEARALADAG